jgi:hypothetical protein
MNFFIHPWSMVSKKLRMSASSTQSVRFLMMTVASASRASCGDRLGRKPYEKPRNARS